MSRNWTLLEVLRWTTEFFTEKGVPNARLDAEHIIAHSLRLKRLELYLRYAQPLNPSERDAIKRLVVRRANREPLQYILGEVEFLDCRLKVDKRALIPRPETEFLAQRILDDSPDTTSLLDVCTGTGAIAISLAKAFERVSAVDVSEEALSLARENAALNDATVEFLQGDLFAPVNGRYGVIVSNPPYISEEEFDKLEPEITMYEPRLALVADDGLTFYRRIVAEAKPYLAEGGRLYLEIGQAQAEAIAAMAEQAGWRVLEVVRDLAGFDRNVILAR